MMGLFIPCRAGWTCSGLVENPSQSAKVQKLKSNKHDKKLVNRGAELWPPAQQLGRNAEAIREPPAAPNATWASAAASSAQRSQSTAQIVFPVSTSRLLIVDAPSSCPTSLKQGTAGGPCWCPRGGLGPRARRFTTAGRPGSQSLLIKSILAGRSPSGTRTDGDGAPGSCFRFLGSCILAGLLGEDGMPWRAISSELFRGPPVFAAVVGARFNRPNES
ncbi:uncharacterized protein TrAtP1_009697 [Trichoderma atroviride]|uniref:uncharacterized protein n=1 Tax=Hypocrea atroviridis TaxID=63577 RepID=UPI00331ECF0C|nr:hypothetical protein TrAtP1_009697 [Trichoderma atroviride]